MSYQQILLLYFKNCVVFFVHSRSRQYRGVPILVTAEMQQTLPVGKTCNDQVANLLLADRRQAISDLQSENYVVSL